MELLNQPFNGQLGDRLINLLDSPDYQTLNIIVAFAKNSGVLRIKGALEKFRKRGGTVNVYVGVDLGGTSYEALTALLLHTDSLYVVHTEKGQTFHTKIYQFVGNDKGLVVIGSHNLTAGGLWTNFESSVLVPVDGSNRTDTDLEKGVNDYIGALTSLKDSFMPIKTQAGLDTLLASGYIFKEVAERVRRANSYTRTEGQTRLFGNGAPVKLPRVITPKDVLAKRPPNGTTKQLPSSSTPPESVIIPRGDEGMTIWFETRAMTGGSGNILDLSSKSLVEHGSPAGTPFELDSPNFMRGSVEFFGLNPTSIEETKDLSINFEGVDYLGNTILFPKGDKSNRSWRIQIKGVTSSGRKVTDAFRAKKEGDYLKYKIVTFTKVQDDYYYMSVFPGSELENFKSASRVVARKGSVKTAKLFGVL